MPSKIYSVAIVGLDAQIVEVEVESSYGLRSFTIVGLPDKAVEESKERIASAIKSIGFRSPYQQPLRVLVNLAPADLKKEGSLYDLPIALGFLVASEQLKFNPEKKIFLGELGLDGKLRPVKGVLSFALKAKEKHYTEIILPKANTKEAALVKDIKVIGIDNLKELIPHLEGKKEITSLKIKSEDLFEEPEYPIDINWIRGQEHGKRALEIAAAGAHNLMMVGPPGAGKTLLAKSLPSILPPLSFEESLEVTKIYSVIGILPKGKPLINIRPFRYPHHTSSEVALIGGGNPPFPGEITLAHRGVLFLDEFPEFHRDVLESLRQPIEEGQITLLRARHSLTLPCSFTLVAASNPCPCGYFNDPEKDCKCLGIQVQKYRRKLSGPITDRMDLFIEVPHLKYEKLVMESNQRISPQIRERVKVAREIQKKRFQNEKNSVQLNSVKVLVNSEMIIPQIKKYCQIEQKSENLLRKAVNSRELSARGYHRVLKVARTIADLNSAEKISFEHLAEALMYRVRES
ncbi:YifB family Mg chelatase-like AAA ATPase [Patescibacteria group bacterium]|nr:YifB family Mg chelatase-like AAA ATPase [Patescibacteria group bacterium]